MHVVGLEEWWLMLTDLHTDNYTNIMHITFTDRRKQNEPKSVLGKASYRSDGEHMTFILLLVGLERFCIGILSSGAKVFGVRCKRLGS